MCLLDFLLGCSCIDHCSSSYWSNNRWCKCLYKWYSCIVDSSPSLAFPECRKSTDLGYTKISSDGPVRTRSSLTGRSALHDNFLSQRTPGIRSSIFNDRLLYLCHPHGLAEAQTQTARAWKTKLIYHLFNGNCFNSRCVTENTVAGIDARRPSRHYYVIGLEKWRPRTWSLQGSFQT
jgi:hypothetical protein